jgi:predicted tellurium resistance membrane protein TerC
MTAIGTPLGLRALYFALHDLMGPFEYLRYGLGLVLSLTGVKVLLADHGHSPVELPLGVALPSSPPRC